MIDLPTSHKEVQMFDDPLDNLRQELDILIKKLEAWQLVCRNDEQFELAKSIRLIEDMAKALKQALVVSTSSLRQDFFNIASSQLEAIKDCVKLLDLN